MSRSGTTASRTASTKQQSSPNGHAPHTARPQNCRRFIMKGWAPASASPFLIAFEARHSSERGGGRGSYPPRQPSVKLLTPLSNAAPSVQPKGVLLKGSNHREFASSWSKCGGVGSIARRRSAGESFSDLQRAKLQRAKL